MVQHIEAQSLEVDNCATKKDRLAACGGRY